MKKITTTIIALSCITAISNAQGGFTKIVDLSNPITTFTTPGIYKGAAWVDIDNDKDMDLYAAPNRLFRNDGGGAFFALSNLQFTPQQNPGGASWADLDNDGDIDCIVAQNPSGVYLNDGTGTFTAISSQIPNLNNFPAWGCAIGDWNKDAFLDFVFAHAAGFHAGTAVPSKIYLNLNSNVTPKNITGYMLTDSVKPYTVPYWSDYDLDNDMDLFVASGPGGSPGFDFCYKNLKVETGKDTLERMTTELFASQTQDGQCYNFIDADNDGDLDLCLTNYAGAETRFYVNTNGTYALQTMPFTATAQNLTNNWGDVDNDGDLDVLITNDNTASKLYRNNGNLSFAQAVNIGVAGGCGIANCDYDNDGDLDLFIHGNGTARALFKNDSVYNNNWVNIKCTGVISNKSAIGTIIKLKATINGISYWQIREVSAQNSFQSQNDLRIHFGLGNATVIDSLIINYSGGQTTTLTGIIVNNFYSHEEGNNNLYLATGISPVPFEEGEDIRLYPNPTGSFLVLETKDKIHIKSWQVFNSDGKLVLYGTFYKQNENRIDTSQLNAGSYHIRIFTNEKTNTLKFIKK